MPPAMRLSACPLLLLLGLPLTAGAEVYRYQDAAGVAVLSNQPTPGAVRLDLPPIPVEHTPPAPAVYRLSRPGPVRSSAHQRRHAPVPVWAGPHEAMRRKLLEHELSEEARQLGETTRRLAAHPGPDEQAQLRARLVDHRKNIMALRQELAATR